MNTSTIRISYSITWIGTVFGHQQSFAQVDNTVFIGYCTGDYRLRDEVLVLNGCSGTSDLDSDASAIQWVRYHNTVLANFPNELGIVVEEISPQQYFEFILRYGAGDAQGCWPVIDYFVKPYHD